MMLIKDSSKMIYYLLSISLDNNLKIWNLESYNLVQTFEINDSPLWNFIDIDNSNNLNIS